MHRRLRRLERVMSSLCVGRDVPGKAAQPLSRWRGICVYEIVTGKEHFQAKETVWIKAE